MTWNFLFGILTHISTNDRFHHCTGQRTEFEEIQCKPKNKNKPFSIEFSFFRFWFSPVKMDTKTEPDHFLFPNFGGCFFPVLVHFLLILLYNEIPFLTYWILYADKMGNLGKMLFLVQIYVFDSIILSNKWCTW